jgi:hypothetical protein
MRKNVDIFSYPLQQRNHIINFATKIYYLAYSLGEKCHLKKPIKLFPQFCRSSYKKLRDVAQCWPTPSSSRWTRIDQATATLCHGIDY